MQTACSLLDTWSKFQTECCMSRIADVRWWKVLRQSGRSSTASLQFVTSVAAAFTAGGRWTAAGVFSLDLLMPMMGKVVGQTRLWILCIISTTTLLSLIERRNYDTVITAVELFVCVYRNYIEAIMITNALRSDKFSLLMLQVMLICSLVKNSKNLNAHSLEAMKCCWLMCRKVFFYNYFMYFT